MGGGGGADSMGGGGGGGGGGGVGGGGGGTYGCSAISTQFNVIVNVPDAIDALTEPNV